MTARENVAPDGCPPHHVRHMRDGTATTRRVRSVAPAPDCTDHAGECWHVLTSWAGNTNPAADDTALHATRTAGGDTVVTGTLADRETPQFLAGIARRVAMATARGKGAPLAATS